MPARRPPTLAAALEDWLKVRTAGRGLSPNTLRAYRADIARVASELAGPSGDGDDRPATKRVTVDQLTPDGVVTALAAIQQAEAAPATRVRIYGTLAGLCAYLVSQGYLTVDPLIAARLERPERPRALPRYVERDEEFARVLVAAGTADPDGRRPWPERDLAIAAVLAGTAARASEVCGIRIRDLILDVDEPYVRVTGKGGAARDCPLPPEVVTAVQAYTATRRQRTGVRARRDDPMWLNNHGRPLTTAALDHYVRRWYARAGVPLPQGAAAHAFRHTVAMQLVGRGEALNVVQALLGHASLSSTQIYIRAAGHHVREAAHALPVREQLWRMSSRDPRPSTSR